MNRSDFQQLADIRITEAKKLLDEGMHAGAYYLAGYAVECALKACIAKNVKQYDFPPKKLSDLYTHELTKLLATAGLKDVLTNDFANTGGLEANWQIVVDWSEESRYEFVTAADANALLDAITSTANGVLQWVKNHW